MTDGAFYKILYVSRVRRGKTKLTTKNKQCSVISYRLKGTSEFRYRNQKFTVTPENILYIPKGSHYTQSTPGEDVIYIHFETLSPTANHLQVLPVENIPSVAEAFQKICEIWNGNGVNAPYYCAAYFYQIIAQTSVTLPEPRANGNITQITDYLKTHATNANFKMTDLYTYCGLSHSRLNTLFKQATGKTPVQYANEMRIEKAKFLLSNGEFATCEIADACGFKDVKYFYTVFRKLTGHTVKEYKKVLAVMALPETALFEESLKER